MELVGTDAADAPAGLGIEKMEVNLLDANFNSVTLSVDTPGAGSSGAIVDPATSNDLWLRCNGMRATLGGATAKVSGVVGTINLEPVGSADLLAQCNAAENPAGWQGCILTIPKDEKTSIESVSFEIFDPSQNSTITGQMYTRRPGEDVWNRELATSHLDKDTRGVGTSDSSFKFENGTDIVLRVFTLTATADAITRMVVHREQRSGAI
jgi:hypothetical protein